MKKKIISLLCAAMLALSMPVMAFAAEFSSPGGATATSNGTTLHMGGDVTSNGGYIVVEASDDHAGNANIPEGDYAASFRAYSVGDIEFSEFDLTFNVPEKYIGANANIYITYGSGNQTSFPVVIDSRGIATALATDISEVPSYFTIVVDASTAQLPSTGGQDNTPTSPQTGVDFTGIAVAAGVMLAAAGGVAMALRKKTSAE